MEENIHFDLPSDETIDQKDVQTGFRNVNSPKLDVTNWMLDIENLAMTTDLVEVQFKNTRKGYYINSNKIQLQEGDLVAVESSPGHDIGSVTLTGELVKAQIRKNNIDPSRYEYKRIYRIAKPNDLEKWEKAKSKEHETMLRSRRIAEDLRLNMKIGDVEFQGDGNKAIFYYIADERVDFRQLIKNLAAEFRVRIEMRQIGARQEAGRIGGIGSCGRELCCSSWMSKFVSVNTVAARWQELSLNPQKLAGQCGKLKCCLNYELDSYVEAQNKLPRKDVVLETQDGTYYLFKTDVFKQELTYSSDPNFAANLVTISASRAREVITQNRKGEKPVKLMRDSGMPTAQPLDFENVVGSDDITRFDKSKGRRSKPRRNNNRNKNNRNPRNEHSENTENPTQKSKPIVVRKNNNQESNTNQGGNKNPNARKGRNPRNKRRNTNPNNGSNSTNE